MKCTCCALEERVTDLEKEVDELQKEVAELQGDKIPPEPPEPEPPEPSKPDEVLLKICGVPVYINRSDGEHVWWTGEMTIDADGHPKCYGPSGTQPLDYLGNAGSPGNWWGVACDPNECDGDPIIQGGRDPCPGYYVSTTAYFVPGYYYSDPRCYLHSGDVPFMVIPGNVRKATVGKCKGCRGKVTDNKTGKTIDCVVGDIGPSDHMGEASMAVADFFGIDSNPKNGGSSDETRFRYECWPGVAMQGFVLQ